MNKIAIIGSGGAGKSTLARKLGAKFHLPIYHLDTYFWKPGWVKTEKDEWENLQNQIIQRDKWIIDGNYSSTLDIRLQTADMIIFLDLPRLLAVYRIVKRRFQYHNKTRPDMSVGCQEKLDWEFIKWVWNFKRDKRPSILNKIDSLKNKKIYILKTQKEVNQFLISINELER